MEYGDSTVVAGNQRNLLERYSRIPLLILDEWLVSDISDAELHFLFELMERRSDTTSTIFCTQYRKDDWVKRLGEHTGGSQKRIAGSERKISGSEQSSDPDPLA